MTDELLLEIKDLTIDFHTPGGLFRVVENLNLSLLRGETHGIVGESGSGKSVTAHSVLRLLNTAARSVSGEILFRLRDGCQIDVLQSNAEEIVRVRGKEVGIIFQEPSLNPVVRCGPQVCESLMVHGRMNLREAAQQTLAYFEEVMLQNPKRIYDSYPHEISGGQKQRVMIAMAIAGKPSLLIADEPTTALDVTVQKSIIGLMKTLQKKYQMAMLFISHDLALVSQVADRVSVILDGRIVETGPAFQLFTNPRHPYTRGLIGCRPSLGKRPDKLPQIADFMFDPMREKTLVEIKTRESDRKLSQAIMYANSPLVSVRNLKVFFEKKDMFSGKLPQTVKAVDDVTFDIYNGETLGLVGESGSGKTTLGRALLRLVASKQGQIYWKGTDLASMSREQLQLLRSKMQIVFQDPNSSLNPRLTIGQAIAEPMIVHRLYASDAATKQKAMELLKCVGLNPDHYQRYPHEFSGGQRQRIVIARALALNPEFIVCDESVSSLDVSVQAQILNLLNDLKKQFHITYLFISHDLSVVHYMSDRIMIMQHGRIVESGDADALMRAPTTDYARRLIESIPAFIYK